MNRKEYIATVTAVYDDYSVGLVKNFSDEMGDVCFHIPFVSVVGAKVKILFEELEIPKEI